ncbi:MAG: 50S ribosomal protein L4 [Candidatus Pacearchaeota archaeon]
MKVPLFDSKGEKKADIVLPEIFNSPIREDIVLKLFEADKEIQPYSTYEEAGKRHVASGKISHRRHKWQTAYGKGISRVPRKRIWRRGTQFYWIGAEVSSTRGGRRAHPPKGNRTRKKINKNEMKIAMVSAFAATANKDYILKRYSSLKDIEIAPAVIENIPSKAKDAIIALKKIFKDAFDLVLKNKVIRSGRGKTRGRKYKSNAGLILITSKNENVKIKGIEIRKLNEIRISDLYPLGRLALFTKKAVEELGEINLMKQNKNKPKSEIAR